MTQRSTQTANWMDPDRLLLWAVRTGILLVLLTPLIVTKDTLFPFVVGKAIFARSVIEVTFALWIVLIIYYRQHRPPRWWVLAALGVWLVVSLIAGFAGVSPVRSLWSTYERMQGIVDLAHWIAFVMVAGSVFRSAQDWRLLFTVNLTVGGLVSLLGVGQYYALFDSVALGSASRITSTLGNATYMGAYAMVNAMIGFSLILHSLGRHEPERPQQPAGRRAARRRRRARRNESDFNYLPWLRAFWILAVLLNLWALWLSGTRGAVAGIGAGALAFSLGYVLWGQLPRVRWAAVAVLVVGCMSIALFFTVRSTTVLDPVVRSSTMLGRLSTIGLEDSSIKGRIVSVGAGLRAYQDRPILGWGPENYLIAWGRYFDGDPDVLTRFDQAHSKVVEALTTTGAVGLLTYLIIWLAMFYVLLRSARHRQGYDQLFVALIGATLVAYFVQNLFLFDTTTTMMLFAVLVAFVVSEEGWVSQHVQSRAAGQEGRAGDTRDSNLGSRLRPVTAPLGRLLRTYPGGTVAVVGIAILTLGSLVWFNFRPYAAAEATLNATRTSLSWDERMARFSQAANQFPALANYSRIYFLTGLSQDLKSLSDEQLTRAASLIASEGHKGLEAEPDNWNLRLSLSQFYQVASNREPEYLPLARAHLEEAVRLAPKTHFTEAIKRQQERLEQQTGR